MALLNNYFFPLSTASARIGSRRPMIHTSRLPVAACMGMGPKRGHAHAGATSIRATAVTPHRRSANYKPDLWDPHFLESLRYNKSYNYMDEEALLGRHEKLKEEVKFLFETKNDNNTDVVELVELVDSIQQLGLGYRFEKEINHSLDFISSTTNTTDTTGGVKMEDLNSIALLFRVLRENGYHVSQDVFHRFLEEDGSFGESCLRHGTKGILSLYDACFYAFPNETLLDDAKLFTTKHLMIKEETSMPKGTQEQIRHALDFPIHCSLPRLHARYFIDLYSRQDNMNPSILELAKLDFNMVQNVHKQEIRELSRWRRNLGLEDKLPFARDRVMECYLFAVGMLSEPQLGRFRIALAQVVFLLTVIDDAYDVYGFIDELELFTDAVGRWNLEAMEQLPEYMKILFLAFFNNVNENTYDILIREKGFDASSYLKKSLWNQSKAYMQEARWYNDNHVPDPEQYLNNALVSIAGPLMLVYTYLLVVQDIKQETLESLSGVPNLVRLTSIINRVCDDMETSTDEMKRGDVHKTIECYIHHQNVSEEEARKKTANMLIETWKKINIEKVNNVESIPKLVVNAAINLSRTFQYLYKHGDGFGSPENTTKDDIMLLLVEEISF